MTRAKNDAPYVMVAGVAGNLRPMRLHSRPGPLAVVVFCVCGNWSSCFSAKPCICSPLLPLRLLQHFALLLSLNPVLGFPVRGHFFLLLQRRLEVPKDISYLEPQEPQER